MKERCSKPNFARYSGRGISVCDEWNDSFMSFYRDMGDRPSKNHSIERINNDGNYSKENCVWATAEEQANNKCSTKKITAFGETLSMSQWSKKIGIAYGTLVNRLNRAKMNPEDALTKNKFSTAKKI